MIEKPGVDSKVYFPVPLPATLLTRAVPQYPHSIDREIIVMKLAEHPSVVRLIDVFESPTHLQVPSPPERAHD